MIEITDIPTFLLACCLIVFSPGPSSIYMIKTVARHGALTGVYAGLGVFVADWLLISSVALGLGQVMQAYPAIQVWLKYLGALFLAYLGVKALINAYKKEEASDIHAAPPGFKAFWQSMGILLINPKALLFMWAFLPMFVAETAINKTFTIFTLGLLLQMVSISYMVILISSTSWLRRQFAVSGKVKKWLNQITGIVFVGFAFKMAF